jgi:hypothetical protein
MEQELVQLLYNPILASQALKAGALLGLLMGSATFLALYVTNPPIRWNWKNLVGWPLLGVTFFTGLFYLLSTEKNKFEKIVAQDNAALMLDPETSLKLEISPNGEKHLVLHRPSIETEEPLVLLARPVIKTKVEREAQTVRLDPLVTERVLETFSCTEKERDALFEQMRRNEELEARWIEEMSQGSSSGGA